MPSLQDISNSEYVLLTKSEADHQIILAVFYNKMTHMETRRLEIGNNERLHPTDCVSYLAPNGNLLYVALNKRTKSSEAHATEIHAYDLSTNMEIGFISKRETTCRYISQATEHYIAAFLLEFCLVLELETLEPLQRINYREQGIFGVVQGGRCSFDGRSALLSFFEPMDATSRVYIVCFDLLTPVYEDKGFTQY